MTKIGQDAAVVTALKIVNLKRTPATPGLYAYVNPEHCGGEQTPILQFNLDLERKYPSLKFIPTGPQAQMGAFPRTVTRDTPDIYEISIPRTSSNYSFDLEVTWESNTEEKFTIEDNNGAHFNLASTSLSRAAAAEVTNLSNGFTPTTLFPDLIDEPVGAAAPTPTADGAEASSIPSECLIALGPNKKQFSVDASASSVGCEDARKILRTYDQLDPCADCGNTNMRAVDGWQCYAPTAAAAIEQNVAVRCDRPGDQVVVRP